MRSRRTAPLLAVAACAVAVGAIVARTDVLAAWEHDTLAARFDVRGERAPAPEVAVVGVDERTLQRTAMRWPFPRREQARLVGALRRMQPRLIVYDIQITEGSDDPDGDFRFFQAVSRARPVVLATTDTDDRGGTRVLGGEENLRDAGAYAGSALLPPRFDRVELAVNALPTLAARTLALTGAPRPPPDRYDDGGAPIAYAGPAGTIPTVSWSDVRAGSPRAARALKGRIVVVGATALILQDVHDTPAPGGTLLSGPEIQANAIATALRGAPLRPAAPAVDAALIVVLGAAVPVLALGWALSALLAAPLLAALHLAAAQLAFGQDRIVEVLPPLVALAAGAGGAATVLLATEARQRRLLRRTLARFAPDAIVDEVLARAEAGGGRLPAVELDATVLFCDLRGFTAFGESHPVATVIETLNRYLDEVADAVMGNGGTMVAYLGDGAMAVFGAPVAQPDHAARALAAARELLGERLDRLNAWLAERGSEHRFTLGVGLNSGPVMSGTVGPERRIEYAAVGDTTNVASRLQAHTRETGVRLLLSEATHERLGAAGAGLRPLGATQLRGRAAPLATWTLDGDDGLHADPGS